MLKLILDRVPLSRVIVAGDFNMMADRARQICESVGLYGLVRSGTPTHVKGGQLDQIYTNITGIEVDVMDNPTSDHKILKAQIRFKRSRDDVNLQDMPIEIR